MFQFHNHKEQEGFTLIELLVVISIIGLLSTVVLASLNTARVKARDAQRIAALKEIKKAIELYASDHGGQYPGYLSTPTLATNEIPGSVAGDTRETTYMRSSGGLTEGSPGGCGYGSPDSTGSPDPTTHTYYRPGIWCKFEHALSPYLKSLPRTVLKGSTYYNFIYKVPMINSATYNPNDIRMYGLGVKLEQANSASQNDGGYDSTMFEIGGLPTYCKSLAQVSAQNWSSWAAVPCSCDTGHYSPPDYTCGPGFPGSPS